MEELIQKLETVCDILKIQAEDLDDPVECAVSGMTREAQIRLLVNTLGAQETWDILFAITVGKE